MPTDFSDYVNLSIFDKDPGDIYLDSIELARVTLPDFNLRIGTPEDAIFQAAAYISALNINAINRLPNRLMAGLVSILGYQRQDAVAAEVDVEITIGDYDGGTIPAGAVFVYDSVFEDELQQFAFTTISPLTLDPTDLDVSSAYPSDVVTVRCIQAGVIPPLQSGAELSVLASGTDIISVVVATPSNFANGLNADLDQEYLYKAATYLRSLTSALNRPNQVDSYVLTTYPSLVGRVKTYDLTNGDDTSGDISINRSAGVITTHMSAGIATIETDAPHLFVVDDVIDLDIFTSSVSATFNGTHTLSDIPTDTTFKFSYGASTSASTSVSGSAYAGQDVSGFITVVAYGLNVDLTANEKASLQEDISAKATAGLIVDVIGPSLVEMSITGSIALSERYDQTALIANIENALVEYLSPAQYPFTYDRIRPNQLIALISSIPGVVYVASLEISPIGDGYLPQHGDDLLFHNKGTLPMLSLDDIDFTYTIFSGDA